MIEMDESIRAAFIALDVEPTATITEIRAQYLAKTSHPKFQGGIINDEYLQKEFDKYYIAYVTLIKHLASSDRNEDMQYYPADQLFQFHFNQGVHHFIHLNYLKAGEKFQEAYKINNQSIPVLLYLGLLLLKRKNYYAAEKYFKDVVKLDKNCDDGWFYLGENYKDAGQLRKALSMYETAKALNPGRNELAFRIKELKERLDIKSTKTKKSSFFQRLFNKNPGK